MATLQRSSTGVSSAPLKDRLELLERLRSQFEGLETVYPLADGTQRRRIYMDSGASNLLWRPAQEICKEAMAHYANTHSQLHFGARIMTSLYEEAHETVEAFVGAGPDYTSVFCGYGVTGCLNKMARTLRQQKPERDVVITTLMEHHANDLPHRKHFKEVIHVPVKKDLDGCAGAVCVEQLAEAVEKYKDRLNYIAITAASNVTGVMNPIHAIARMAHDAGALIVVDAAQSAAHFPLQMETEDPREALDVVCLSGHKIYSPGSPGVIIARKELFLGIEPQEVGGGIVKFVDANSYTVTDHLPEREETGTPNLPGVFTLASTLKLLMHLGMDVVEEDERSITQYALDQLADVPQIQIYGSTRLEIAERIGVITFNIGLLEHGLVTAILNDYFGIAVRNQCFCAQPFVRQLLGIADDFGQAPAACMDRCDTDAQPGMVRLSFGLYNTKEEVDYVVDALKKISANQAGYLEQYEPVWDGSGDWRHKTFTFEPSEAFNLDEAVRNYIQ